MILKLAQLSQALLRTRVNIQAIQLVRKCSVTPKRSDNVKIYDVQPRCTLNGFIAYKTIVLPHDVNNTTETDKLILKCNKDVSVNHIGNAFNITTPRESYDENTVCELHVPLKANINLTTLGDIQVGDLQGDGVRVFSELGSVTLGNLKCSDVSIGTNDKDIIVGGNIEAAKVEFLCRRTGSIQAQKIKSLGMKFDTNEGNIQMNACYSRNSYFITKTGNLDLKNVHNRCRIETLKKGNIKLVGFEGALEVSLQNGKADIQVQKLYDNSDILVREEGEITLRLPLELLDNTTVMVWSRGCYVDDEIPHIDDDLNDLTTVRKEGVKTDNVLRVRCLKANCNVRLASWIDMMTKDILESRKTLDAKAKEMKIEVQREEAREAEN